MPRKDIREPDDVDDDGDYKLRITPIIVRQLVRLAKNRGLYWTDIATLLLTDGLQDAGLWPVKDEAPKD